jgi:hypothetical protein
MILTKPISLEQLALQKRWTYLPSNKTLTTKEQLQNPLQPATSERWICGPCPKSTDDIRYFRASIDEEETVADLILLRPHVASTL